MNGPFEAIIDLLFPPRCPLCGKITQTQDICPACRKVMPAIAAPEAVQPVGESLCAAPLWYSGPVRQALLDLKFSGERHIAQGLGQIMAECAAEHFSGQFDTVSWVPVSRKRLRRRGYDQAQLLCRSVCRHWDSQPRSLLLKVQDNPAQSGLSDRRARLENVRGVYTAAPGADAAGRRVLLLDDIHTTGATLSEAVRVLMQAGARQVLCLTAARTPPETKKGKNSPLPSCNPPEGTL